MTMETLKLEMGPKWEEEYGVSNVDYNIDFITYDQNCTLHDGTYADFYNMDSLSEAQRIELLCLALRASSTNKDKFIAGAEYAKKHGIKQCQWMKEDPREEELTKKIIYRFDSYLEDVPGWERIDEGYNYNSLSAPKATWKFSVNDKCGSYITVGLEGKTLMTIARVVGERKDGSPYVTDKKIPHDYPGEDEMDEYGIVINVLEKYENIIVPGYENLAKCVAEGKRDL